MPAGPLANRSSSLGAPPIPCIIPCNNTLYLCTVRIVAVLARSCPCLGQPLRPVISGHFSYFTLLRLLLKNPPDSLLHFFVLSSFCQVVSRSFRYLLLPSRPLWITDGLGFVTLLPSIQTDSACCISYWTSFLSPPLSPERPCVCLLSCSLVFVCCHCFVLFYCPASG